MSTEKLRKVIQWGLVAAILMLGLVACQQGQVDEAEPAQQEAQEEVAESEQDSVQVEGDKQIGMVSICATCTGEARAISSLRAATEDRGWSVQVVDSAGDFEAVISAVDNFITQEVDAVILGAIDPTPLSDVIERANSAGIPVLVESGLWTEGVALQVGQDSFRMGQIQGTYMVERMEGEGKVLMLTFRPARNVAMREDVVRTTFSHYEEIEVVEVHEVDISNAIEDARQATETILLREPDLTAIWCGWDDLCTGAAAAVDGADRDDVFMIGNDAGDEALERIRDPESAWDVTVYVDYRTIGQVIVEELDKIFAGQELPYKNIYVELPLVTVENVPDSAEELPSVDTYILYEQAE